MIRSHPPPVPANELPRLHCLHGLAIDLDAPMAELQDLCRIAAEIAGSEVALISLIDEDEQLFAAAIGLDDLGLAGVRGTPRDISFCAHAIMTPDQLVVADATEDARFAQNPLVIDLPGIRAYAGTPLEPETGLRIGTLCVIDRTPRIYDAETLRQLKGIAGAVTALLVAHRDRLRLADALRECEAQRVQALRTARTDGLTGILNATTFRQACMDAAVAPSQRTALVLMDVDRFKIINDRYGHGFGDRYLVALAHALQTAAPLASEVGRLGGDEFGILLRGEHADRDGIAGLVAACRRNIEVQTKPLDRPGLGQVCFGAAIRTAGTQSAEELFQQADIALYMAKESGRNRSSIYDADHGNRFDGRILRAEFDAALCRNEIIPFYQPQWNLRSGAITGFEVLCRWRHPMRGLLAPGSFLDILRDHQTGAQLTRTLFAQVCDNHGALRDEGLDAGRLAFNVTHHDLTAPDFVDFLAANLAASKLQWDRIIVEVTESTLAGEENGQIHATLAALRRRGATIALDDFGTGNGGLQHLATWPIDTIKIDRSLVARLGPDMRAGAVVRSIVTLARSLRMSVVAEGIEIEDQAAILRDMGCDKGQGYLCGRPMSCEGLKTFLQSQRTRLPKVVRFG